MYGVGVWGRVRRLRCKGLLRLRCEYRLCTYPYPYPYPYSYTYLRCKGLLRLRGEYRLSAHLVRVGVRGGVGVRV